MESEFIEVEGDIKRRNLALRRRTRVEEMQDRRTEENSEIEIFDKEKKEVNRIALRVKKTQKEREENGVWLGGEEKR